MKKKNVRFIYYLIITVLLVLSTVGFVAELEKNPKMSLVPQTWGAYALYVGIVGVISMFFIWLSTMECEEIER